MTCWRSSTELYLQGQRVDITVVAARLGLGRATIYRWFGSRDALLGEVIARQLELLVARKRARGQPPRRRRPARGARRASTRRSPAPGRSAGCSSRSAAARCGCSPRARAWSNRGRWRASRADRGGDGLRLRAAGRPRDARLRPGASAPCLPVERRDERGARRLRAAARSPGGAARDPNQTAPSPRA